MFTVLLILLAIIFSPAIIYGIFCILITIGGIATGVFAVSVLAIDSIIIYFRRKK